MSEGPLRVRHRPFPFSGPSQERRSSANAVPSLSCTGRSWADMSRIILCVRLKTERSVPIGVSSPTYSTLVSPASSLVCGCLEPCPRLILPRFARARARIPSPPWSRDPEPGIEDCCCCTNTNSLQSSIPGLGPGPSARARARGTARGPGFCKPTGSWSTSAFTRRVSHSVVAHAFGAFRACSWRVGCGQPRRSRHSSAAVRLWGVPTDG